MDPRLLIISRERGLGKETARTRAILWVTGRTSDARQQKQELNYKVGLLHSFKSLSNTKEMTKTQVHRQINFIKRFVGITRRHVRKQKERTKKGFENGPRRKSR
ncbi:hypothetical protein EUGRSUZ_H03923 [Eucalyptus grandis]|uniref:Uncharacterized protein n=2 Tax=Eucalyptus grandis TaxID=71139 RepID=A0ACC3JVF4_EUCGR|nr:hypothetical protein EUGRSUZ_H03923 [Eucalyptus grandis]